MKRIIAITTIAFFATGCATTGSAPAYDYQTTATQVVKEVDGHEAVYSIGDDSFVTLSPRYEELSKHQGTMFVVGALNSSGEPIRFGPANIRVTDANGQSLKLLNRKDVKEIEAKRQRGKKLFSDILATATTFAVAYAASDYIVDQQVAGYDTSLLQYQLTHAVAGIGESAFNASSLYNSSLDKEVTAQIKHFENKALTQGPLQSGNGGGGFFVINGDPQGLSVEISVGGDLHQFSLTRK